MKNYLSIASDAARVAGELQLQSLGKNHHIQFKGEINLVTEVDKACEEIIQKKIQGAFPEHDFLAEEGGGTRRHSDYKWIVDPLDGTTNFAHGYPLFCVSIALEYKGEILVAVVYDPNRDELFAAQKGQGATLNGQKIAVSKIDEINQAMLATGFAYNVRSAKETNINHFTNMLMNAQAVRRDGVAAIDLCYVACGRYDGFWELNLFPWDVAAGKLILEEAGGRVSLFSGDSFSVYDKEILCSNNRIHQQMIDVLRK